MFSIGKKKIKLENDGLFVRKKLIRWDDILGIRRFDSKILTMISPQFPACQLFLKGGKSLLIDKHSDIDNGLYKSYHSTDNNSPYYLAINVISEKAININSKVSGWFEWRVLLPPFITGTLFLFYLLLSGISVFDSRGAVVVICTLPVGIVWEYFARKKIWQ